MTLTTNFGFGPVSKLNTIINTIKAYDKNIEMDFFGNGISLEFLRGNGMVSKYYEVDSDKEFEEISKNINSYDLIINVMNIDILSHLKSKNTKLYFVDSLSMLWNEKFEGAEAIDCYFIQKFFESEDNIKKMNIPYKVIGPIISVPKKKNYEVEKKNELLINFSGLYNPYSKEDFFYNFAKITSSIIMELFGDKYDQIIFCCNKKLSNRLSDECNYKNARFDFYNHDDFLKLCLSVKDIFSLSGITFYLESSFMNLNVKYLLPSNYYQYILNNKYRKNDLAITITLEDINKDYEIDMDVSEGKGVELVEKYITETLLNHKEEYATLIKKVICLIKNVKVAV